MKTPVRFAFLISICLLLNPGAASAQPISDDNLLDTLQHTAFRFFWNEANASNGLIKDRSTSGSASSIASVGFGLSAINIGVERGWVSRAAAAQRVLTTLRTFWLSPQGDAVSGLIGHKGFFYHFLKMSNAQRDWDCELSTIDTGLLFAGIIDAKQFFSGSDTVEVEIRALADSIYYRADWKWFRNFNPGVLMGWKPTTQFGGFGQWTGYNEAMILYILGYGSPTRPISDEYGWQAWTGAYQGGVFYGQSYIQFAPLFGHQYSHCWVDFRGIQDAYMLQRGLDYFENSRRATYAARSYCIDNPKNYVGYSDSLWGLTACDGPNGYRARGAPGNGTDDDGTIAPTAAISSLPFAPEIVMPAIRNMWESYRPQLWTQYGFRDAFNLTQNWFGPDVIGIDQGPIIIMIENYRTGSVWARFMQNADVQRGLQRIGFQPTLSSPSPDPSAGARPATDFSLSQNYPNPFNPETVINYDLRTTDNVSLKVFDVLGKEVATLVSERKSAGNYSVRFLGNGLPSGMYFYRLQIGGQAVTRKMALVK